MSALPGWDEIRKFAVLATIQLAVLTAAVFLVVKPFVASVNETVIEQMRTQVQIEARQANLKENIAIKEAEAKQLAQTLQDKIAAFNREIDALVGSARPEELKTLIAAAGKIIDEHKDAATLIANVGGLIDRFRVGTVAVTTGSTVIDMANPVGGAIWFVRVDGEQYDYRYMLVVAHNGYGDPGSVSVVARLREFEFAAAANRRAWGAPEFSVDREGRLVVTNDWNEGGVNLTYSRLDPFP